MYKHAVVYITVTGMILRRYVCVMEVQKYIYGLHEPWRIAIMTSSNMPR